MFYAASKFFWFVFQPSSVLWLVIAAGAALLKTAYDRAGRRLLWTGLLGLLVLGLSPLGEVLIEPLEDRFPRPELSSSEHIDGIIVLGGAEDMRVGGLRGLTALNEAAERLTEAVLLARKFPAAKVVFSGGSAELIQTKPPEAEGARRFFLDFGIDPARLVLEDRSRTTYENAEFTRDVVKPKLGERWLLVTSAFHMPRAVGCFRKAGFDVMPFPVDYRSAGWDDVVRPFSSIPEGLRRVDFIFKEYVGLLSYYLSGRTSALFPGP